MRGEEGEGIRRWKRVREDGACSISNDLHTGM